MCESDKIKQGFVVASFDSTNIYEPPSNICLKYEKSYIRLKRQDTIAPFPMHYFKDNQLPDGVFNFVFGQDKTLYAAPIENGFEIGSKHKYIAAKFYLQRILASGEMLKSGSILRFNLSSGTFMKDFMLKTLEGKCNKQLVDHTRQLFGLHYPAYSIEYTTSIFITDAIVPLKHEHLVKYANVGYEPRMYSMKKLCLEESGPYTTFQTSGKRKTFKSKYRLLHNGNTNSRSRKYHENIIRRTTRSKKRSRSKRTFDSFE